MNAVEALRVAQENGVRLGVVGSDLILDTHTEPPADVVEAICRHKAEIIELLAPPKNRWSARDWLAFFDERAGIAEFDSGQTRAEAAAFAFECCIVEWLNRHPQHSDPDRCAWCEKPDRDGHSIVPFGTESHGHTWLHPECWNDWSQDRRETGQRSLAAMGLKAPLKCAEGTN